MQRLAIKLHLPPIFAALLGAACLEAGAQTPVSAAPGSTSIVIPGAALPPGFAAMREPDRRRFCEAQFAGRGGTRAQVAYQSGVVQFCVRPDMVASSATSKVGEGERPMQPRIRAFKADEVALVSNPFIAMRQKSQNPENGGVGFFSDSGVSLVQCTRDGGLLVRGSAHFDAKGEVPRSNVDEGTANGLWKVSAEGAITPHAVSPFFEPRLPHICDRRECVTATRETWARARGTGAKGPILAQAEDRKGNVWIARMCSLSQFKPDGSEQVILSPETACYRHMDTGQTQAMLDPVNLAYDAATDQIVLQTQNAHVSTLWRVSQDGRMQEVFSAKWPNPWRRDLSNVMPPPPNRELLGFAVDGQGSIFFISNLRNHDNHELFRIAPGQSQPVALGGGQPSVRSNDIVHLDGPVQQSKFRSDSIGAACADPAGNWYFVDRRFSKGQAGIVRKLDAKTQRITTWVY